MIDPEMPSQQLRLHMGELTSDEVLVARAAIEWAQNDALEAAAQLVDMADPNLIYIVNAIRALKNK